MHNIYTTPKPNYNQTKIYTKKKYTGGIQNNNNINKNKLFN